jgi:hypothetical protein
MVRQVPRGYLLAWQQLKCRNQILSQRADVTLKQRWNGKREQPSGNTRREHQSGSPFESPKQAALMRPASQGLFTPAPKPLQNHWNATARR